MQENYDQLSELGLRQSKILGAYLANSGEKFDKVFLGPLKRHRQTMECVQEAYQSRNLPWPTPVLVNGLDEHQGPEVMNMVLPKLMEKNERLKNWSQKIEEFPNQKRKIHLQMFTYFMSEWAKGSLDVEHAPYLTWAEFRRQVQQGLEHILHNSGRGVTVAAFTSGGTTAAAVGHALQMNDEEKVMGLNGIVHNTAITEFLFSKEKITLKSFNRIPHLNSEELRTFV